MRRTIACLFSSLLLGAPAVLAFTAPTVPPYALQFGGYGTSLSLLKSPAGIAVDVEGNVYVVDAGNWRVQAFDPLGGYMTSGGGHGADPGSFMDPVGIAVHPSGTIYVTDYTNENVQYFDLTSGYLGQWGSAGVGDGQFGLPYGVALDAAGNVYVVDLALNRVQRFSSTGTFQLKWGGSGSGDGQFAGPRGIAISSAGIVYVTDTNNHRVQRFSTSGAWLGSFGSQGSGDGQFSYPNGIAVDALGRVHVADQGNHRIEVFSPTGTYLTQWGGAGSGDGQFNSPNGVAVDGAGDVYVLESNGSRVQKFSGSGMAPGTAAWTGLPLGFAPLTPMTFGTFVDVETKSGYFAVLDRDRAHVDMFGYILWGSEPTFTLVDTLGTPGTGLGQFTRPLAIAANDSGYLYVADTGNHRVQRLSRFAGLGFGAFDLAWGSFGTGNGQFSSPSGLAAAPGSGVVYVSDTGNNRVQRFGSNGTYLGKWGTAGTGAGQFNAPLHLAVDAAGCVYVIDSGNRRVQKFTGDGTYIRQWGSYGTGPGQFVTPCGIDVTSHGTILVSDSTTRTVQEFTGSGRYLGTIANVSGVGAESTRIMGLSVGDALLGDPTEMIVTRISNLGASWYRFDAPPRVTLVSDVSRDEGRQVRLLFDRGHWGITDYNIYRRIEWAPAESWGGATVSAPGPVDAALIDWDVVGSVADLGEARIAFVAPTLVDATLEDVQYSAFLVRGIDGDGNTFQSAVAYGRSADNLAPPAPAPFTAAYAGGATHLHWGSSSARDFAYFQLCRGTSADFVSDANSLIATPADTQYVDPGAAGRFYKLAAVDRSGNVSAYSLVRPDQTVSAEGTPAPVFALAGPRPNPARAGRATVVFSLPAPGAATLELLDVSGRRVVRREVGTLGAGVHTVDLARDRRLPAGVYLVRLERGGETRVARLAVLD